jgi:hypothetical protein
MGAGDETLRALQALVPWMVKASEHCDGINVGKTCRIARPRNVGGA